MAAAKPRGKSGRTPRYAITSASKNGARRTIVNGLIGYNRERAGNASWQSFAVVLNGSKGKVLGGLSGTIGWGWMYIELFWLPGDSATQGPWPKTDANGRGGGAAARLHRHPSQHGELSGAGFLF